MKIVGKKPAVNYKVTPEDMWNSVGFDTKSFGYGIPRKEWKKVLKLFARAKITHLILLAVIKGNLQEL